MKRCANCGRFVGAKSLPVFAGDNKPYFHYCGMTCLFKLRRKQKEQKGV